MAISKSQLLSIEQKLFTLIDACQKARDGEETPTRAYSVLVGIESGAHDAVRSIGEVTEGPDYK